jgi:glycosyltransferase involved in cell wall biosynthesis
MLFPGRLGVQQRVLPGYRAAFFDLLAAACRDGLEVFAGEPLAVEEISPAGGLGRARLRLGRNRHFQEPSSPFYLCWQEGLPTWLEGCDPAALIVEANPRLLSTRRAIAWMQARRRPVLGWGLGAPPLEGRLAGLRAWERGSLLGRLDGVIAYSRRGAAEYRAALQALGRPETPVFIAPNAAVPRPGQAPPPRPAELSGPPGLLFVGRLQARKRIDLLLYACAGLPEAHRPRLIIVGDGPARAALQSLAAQIYPAAEFPGAAYGAALEAYFARAELFVLPGTGGLAAQQALAHGLPLIVAQGDGTQEDLVRPENGWLVPPDDLGALQAALAGALADLPRLRRMGAESFRIAREEINLEAMVDAFIRAVRSVD